MVTGVWPPWHLSGQRRSGAKSRSGSVAIRCIGRHRYPGVREDARHPGPGPLLRRRTAAADAGRGRALVVGDRLPPGGAGGRSDPRRRLRRDRRRARRRGRHAGREGSSSDEAVGGGRVPAGYGARRSATRPRSPPWCWWWSRRRPPADGSGDGCARGTTARLPTWRGERRWRRRSRPPEGRSPREASPPPPA